MSFPIHGDEHGRSFIAIRAEDAWQPPFKHCPVCGPLVRYRPCGHLLPEHLYFDRSRKTGGDQPSE